MTMKRLATTKAVYAKHVGKVVGAVEHEVVSGQLVATATVEPSKYGEGLEPFPVLEREEVRRLLTAAPTLRDAMASLGLWRPDAHGSAVTFHGTVDQAIALLDHATARGRSHDLRSGRAGVTIRAIPGKDGRGYVAPMVVRRYLCAGRPDVVAVAAAQGCAVRHVPGGLASLTAEDVCRLLKGRVLSDQDAYESAETWPAKDRERTVSLMRDAIALLPEGRKYLYEGIEINVHMLSRTSMNEAQVKLMPKALRYMGVSMRTEPSELGAVLAAITRKCGYEGQRQNAHEDILMPHWSPCSGMGPYAKTIRLYEQTGSATMAAARMADLIESGGVEGARARLTEALAGEGRILAIVEGAQP